MMKSIPLIGISGSLSHDESVQSIARDYMTAILSSGGLPLLLSMDMPDASLNACLGQLSGVLLSGGTDVEPSLYGEHPIPGLGEVDPLRDQFEIRLIRACHQHDLPVLGICRGVQSMNIALGGTVYQDISAQHASPGPAMLHSQTSLGKYASHPVHLEEGTKLAQIFLKHTVRVNSFHHQAVCKPVPAFIVSAFAPDGVIEAIEDASRAFFVGVQWHPERMYREDEDSRKLFDAFIAASARHLPQANYVCEISK